MLVVQKELAMDKRRTARAKRHRTPEEAIRHFEECLARVKKLHAELVELHREAGENVVMFPVLRGGNDPGRRGR